jgi:hypothetical protein
MNEPLNQPDQAEEIDENGDSRESRMDPKFGPASPEEIEQARREGDRYYRMTVLGENPPPKWAPGHHPGGRPTLLTPELLAEAVKWAKLGAHDTVIAKKLGIEWRTWLSWKDKGRRGLPGPWVEFVTQMDAAYSEGELTALLIWKKGMVNDWRAAAEYLARRYPKRWGRQRVEVSGPGGKPLPAQETHFHLGVDLSKLTDDELDLVSRMAAKSGALAQAAEPVSEKPIEGEAKVVTRDTARDTVPQQESDVNAGADSQPAA